ncbi:adenosyl-hopene transferase HpnH [Beijerinckia sp. L45]|uniref:adenosyl-hopene transferase HpnH n=1 Tax=Beijerinckia sp. L45 TaxID=1641855 RepID=UPI00131B5CAC|nr:adenosyl-hopene transferase HpnH [Beijerinckia sp. L45]
MGIPFLQMATVGSYVARQEFFGKKIAGKKRYPLVLMLEPLFRCNLACAGCGKIDYPDKILNERLPVADALAAMDECGAPVVVVAGGEPLLHKELPQIVEGAIAKKKWITVCTNALLLEKNLHKYKPNKYFNWSIHLDGDKAMHDKSVCQQGVYDKALAALKKAKEMGFRVTINATLFNDADPVRVAKFLDEAKTWGIEGVTVSPGYAYERAPDQQHFLNRAKTKELFRSIFALGEGGKRWPFYQSALFLDFLAGNKTYQCTPWGNPTLTVFGWQKPCYLLGEGYTKTFKELMETTEWDKYGTGNYEKCADCMVHCGFEATAVTDSFRRPWKLIGPALRGIRSKGKMAPELSLANQRPAEFVFSRHVEKRIAEIDAKPAVVRAKQLTPAE